MRIVTALQYIANKELGSHRNRNIKFNPFIKGIGAQLPESYRRFWEELTATPSPVHYKPREGEWELDSYGVVKPIQNTPIPLRYAEESHDGIWGGEAIIQGFRQEGNKYTRRVAAWWIPTLRESVLYSEVLRKHLKVTITDRTIDLVHKNQGFDQYLLNTKACDLQSWLALRLKRKILFTIRDKTYSHQGADLDYVMKIFDPYLKQFDHEYIEWYGLPLQDAKEKLQQQLDAQKVVVPLKEVYRKNLLKELQCGSSELLLSESQPEGNKLLSYPANLIGKAKAKLFSPQ